MSTTKEQEIMSASTKARSRNAAPKVFGYLPNDVPPWWKLIVLGFQHVITMFPATVLVALLVGFDVANVLFVSGLATVTALVLSKVLSQKFIPLYYGSSFSYIAATLALTKAEFGVYAGADVVRLVQVGIFATGLVNIAVGFIIRRVGKEALDKVLPPIITGSVALVIGVTLSGSALNMAFGGQDVVGALVGAINSGQAAPAATVALATKSLIVAVVTLLTTIGFSVYLQGKGFIGLIPILLGAVVGYALSAAVGLVDYTAFTQARFFALPKVTLPAFGNPRAWEAVAAIAIIAIATIPESTAHLYQISLYVDRLADQLRKKRYELDKLIGLNLILDGLGDSINGLLGGVAGTNYGENNSLMAITRNYSGPALVAAGIIAILLGFVGKLSGLVNTVPQAVTGGLAIYLFGVIGMQGIALIEEKKVNLFDPRQLAIGAVITTVAIGGQIIGGGNIPIVVPGVFPNGLPAIATGAVCGILLNVVFLIFPGPRADS
jgi:uracil permease